jgi:hypothetical protein
MFNLNVRRKEIDVDVLSCESTVHVLAGHVQCFPYLQCAAIADLQLLFRLA